MKGLPVVVVLGRPNVGKSSLVNRILGRRAAVVEERPGVTRDRREFEAEWAGRRFLLVDTGGWAVTGDEALTVDIRAQAEAALDHADVVLLVADARTGITEDDAAVTAYLRRSGLPVVLVANKVDEAGGEWDAASLWSLGLGEPMPASALHGRGVGDLLDRLVDLLPESEPDADGDGLPTLAIIGRPNVGKSTLLNRLVGAGRVLVSPTPGTTRDPVDVVVGLGEQPYRVVDTAGIRRAARVEEATEYYSIIRARQALEEADVALLMLDGTDGVTHQDQRLAEEVVSAGAGLVILANKWDALDEEGRLNVADQIADRLSFVDWAPLLRISAKTGWHVGRLPAALAASLGNRQRRIATGELNRLVRAWQEAHPPPPRKGRRTRILYAVQAAVAPPTVLLFCSGEELGPDYLRYLEKRLRETADWSGTPIRLVARRRTRRPVGV